MCDAAASDDTSCEEKIPIAHVHVLSAKLPTNALRSDGQYFVRVSYNEIDVGKTTHAATTGEKPNKLSWDQGISVSLPIESIRAANGDSNSRHLHLPERSGSVAVQENAEVTFAYPDSLVIEVYGTWVQRDSNGHHHDKEYLAGPITAATDDIIPDLLFDPARIFLLSSSATRQWSSLPCRRSRTASIQKLNGCSHDEETLGYCAICPTVLRELAEEGEPVELHLWSVNRRRNWKPIGTLRLCISLFRLQVRIVGAVGFPPAPSDSRMMLSVKWRGEELTSKPLMWMKGFCIKPNINGRLAIIIHSDLLSADIPPKRMIFRFDGTMLLSSFDPEGLVDILNNHSKAAYIGTMELHHLGFEFGWDKKMQRFTLQNKLGTSFTLLGKESPMATELLGFHAKNYVSRPYSTVLHRTTDRACSMEGVTVTVPHCDGLLRGAVAENTMKVYSVCADKLPLPLMAPEWNEIVWGPSMLDIASSGGDLDIDVHLEPLLCHQSSLSLTPRGAGEAIASALFRRRPARCIVGRATINMLGMCEYASGLEQQLSLFPLISSCSTMESGGEVVRGNKRQTQANSSYLKRVGEPPPPPPLEQGGGEPLKTLSINGNYFVDKPACNNEEAGPPPIGAVRIAVKFADQSQILKSALRKWTCCRDERIHSQLLQSMAESKAQGHKYMMFSPFCTSWVDIVDAIQMLCLLTYSIIMVLRAYHVARCSEDWACVATKDTQLNVAECWQNYLDTTMTWLAVAHVCIKFRTGYLEPNGTVVMDPGKVARRYLLSSFIIDALCCLPHDILSRLSGQEWVYGAEVVSKSDPGTPLARLVFAMSRRLHWPALNRILKQRNFVRLDLLIQDILVLKDGIVGIIRGKRVVLHEMGLSIPKRSKMARFRLLVMKSRRWIHRTFEYKLLFYAKFAGGFLRGIKLLYMAFFRFLRMVRLARVAMVAVRSYTRKERYSSFYAEHCIQKCVRNHMATTLTNGIANRRRRKRGGGGGYCNEQQALLNEDGEGYASETAATACTTASSTRSSSLEEDESCGGSDPCLSCSSRTSPLINST